MDRRTAIVLLGAVAPAWPRLAAAQQRATVPLVGFLDSGSERDAVPTLDAFHQGLRSAGAEPGRGVAIDYRWAEGRNERLPALAAELVRSEAAVIAAFNAASALAAKA